MKIVFMILGFIFTGIGLIGVYLPVLPTTPFLLLAAACFARGSEKFHQWLTELPMYQNNVEPVLNGKGMTKEKKYKVLAVITVLFAICFALIPVKHARMAIPFVLVFHYYIFLKRIPTQTRESAGE